MLNEVTNDDNDKTEEIISSIQNTMTDKCPTELKMNRMLSETQIQLTQTDIDTEEEKEEYKPIMNEFKCPLFIAV